MKIEQMGCAIGILFVSLYLYLPWQMQAGVVSDDYYGIIGGDKEQKEEQEEEPGQDWNVVQDYNSVTSPENANPEVYTPVQEAEGENSEDAGQLPAEQSSRPVEKPIKTKSQKQENIDTVTQKQENIDTGTRQQGDGMNRNTEEPETESEESRQEEPETERKEAEETGKEEPGASEQIRTSGETQAALPKPQKSRTVNKWRVAGALAVSYICLFAVAAFVIFCLLPKIKRWGKEHRSKHKP